jgi:Family of unknown function (DUF5709)
MDEFEAYQVPVSDPEADGLPEVADPDSHAEEELDDVRVADGRSPAPLPPDREDGPLGLDEYGTSSGQRGVSEPLRRKLRRELPDTSPESVAGEGWPLDNDMPDGQAARRPDEDKELLEEDEPVDPQLTSPISMYDRSVPGIPSLDTIGRLAWPDDRGLRGVDPDLGAYDMGSAGGGFTAEEAAMHEVPESEMEGSDDAELVGVADFGSDVPADGPAVRTGSDQQWDAEDLAVAEGHDPTPANVAHARKELDELGPAAIEKTVP